MRFLNRTPRARGICMLSAVCVATIIPPAAVADVVVNDSFDAAVLDPAWTVTLDFATSWTYEIAASWLTVSHIEIEEQHEGWSSVMLSQEFEPLDDLLASVDLGWDCEGTRRAMQNITMVLVDPDDEWVAWASCHDAWNGSVGRITAGVGELFYQGPNDLPLAGTGNLTISRNGGQVTIYWNDADILAGEATTPVDRLELWFQIGIWPTATFGQLSVDSIRCEGTVTTPATNLSWGQIKSMFQ